jgi:hypothetical protein
MQMQMEPTNYGTSVKLREGFWTGPPKRRQQFYRERGENTWALCRGQLHRPLAAAVPPPLFTSNKREASLVGGNCGVQKCDSADPLRLVIKCIGGGGLQVGGLDSPDYQQTASSLWRPSQHTHMRTSVPTSVVNLTPSRTFAAFLSRKKYGPSSLTLPCARYLAIALFARPSQITFSCCSKVSLDHGRT